MLNRRQVLVSTLPGTLGGVAWFGTRPALAAGYPSRPIRLVVPFPPGGTTDIVARAIAGELALSLKQAVVVDNKAGAGGNVGTAEVARAEGDGHTLLMCTVGTHAINAAIYPKLPFDPVKDFAPVSLVAAVPNVLVVPAASPFANVPSLVRALKANPGGIPMRPAATVRQSTSRPSCSRR